MSAALEADLRKWIAEFHNVSSDASRMPAFLATRLVESGVVNDADNQNVVRATVGRGRAVRRIRILKWHNTTKHLEYELTDPGYQGAGMCRVDDVVREDNPKLADILDRLEGKA